MLVDKTGLTCGSSIVYNSGCMSTSAGPNAGRSKAIPLSYALYGFNVPYALDLNFAPAWTTLDMKHISASRIPIIMRLAQAVEDKFWVSCYLQFFKFNFSISRLISMRLSSSTLTCPPFAFKILMRIFLDTGCGYPMLLER